MIWPHPGGRKYCFPSRLREYRMTKGKHVRPSGYISIVTIAALAAMLVALGGCDGNKETAPMTTSQTPRAADTADPAAAAKYETATFAAGCFWGVEATFRKVPGVIDTSVGYTGGTTKNPTYKDVCTDRTGHAEAVQVIFDPATVSYEKLLAVFWACHDPTTPNRQGPDYGSQYRSAIFCHGPGQESAATASKERLRQSGRFKAPIVTEIAPAGPFWRAEDYHQRYHEKHGGGACPAPAAKSEMTDAEWQALTPAEWKARLSPEQYHVMREAGTEQAFTGTCLNDHRPGVYACAACGLPLFNSGTKFESGTGWPSFWQPTDPKNVVLKTDDSLGMARTEVLCRRCRSHLGHVFDDGPPPTGRRYCMNGVALKFVAPGRGG